MDIYCLQIITQVDFSFCHSTKVMMWTTISELATDNNVINNNILLANPTKEPNKYSS